jgi:hypothetical protein
MAIDSTYRKIKLEEYLKDQLRQGIIPSFSDIETLLYQYNNVNDFTVPQFLASEWKVIYGEESSKSKFKNTIDAIYQDLQALLTEMKSLTETSIDMHEQWQTEIEAIESSAMKLEERVSNLIIVTNDVDGYVNYVADTFVDLSLIDQDLTTIDVNPTTHIATLAPSSRVHHPLSLNIKDEDISFRIASKSNGIVQQTPLSSLKNAVTDKDENWQVRLSTEKDESITAELQIKISDTPIGVSRIDFIVQAVNQGSSLQITPMYSNDGYNFSQLPGTNPTQTVIDVGVFYFPKTSMTHVKFLLSKATSDYEDRDRFIFEFGAKRIQFFEEAFDTTTEMDPKPRLISKPLSVVDTLGEEIQFSRLSLDSCESIQDKTNIHYFVTISNDSEVPVTISTDWFAIDPSSRKDKESNSVLDIGDLSSVVYGDTEDVKISYIASPVGGGVGADQKSPAADFNLIHLDINGDLTNSSVSSSDEVRYVPVNSNDRILSYQFKIPKSADLLSDPTEGPSFFLIDKESLKVWRNIGAQGLDSSLNTSKVRGIQRGWKFEDPFYFCWIRINNPEGKTVSIGDQFLWIDDKPKRGNSVIISGKNDETGATGEHLIKIHKDNWLEVSANIETLQELITADTLYPFNHKLLIEGYSYPEGFDSTEQIYTGVDLFAETRMDEIPILDFLNSLPSDNYGRFAIDRDYPGSYNDPFSGTTNLYSNMIFLVKIDENKSDSLNETFRIELKIVDQKFKYLRLKAEFETEDEDSTPLLSGYKIRIA